MMWDIIRNEDGEIIDRHPRFDNPNPADIPDEMRRELTDEHMNMLAEQHTTMQTLLKLWDEIPWNQQ